MSDAAYPSELLAAPGSAAARHRQTLSDALAPVRAVAGMDVAFFGDAGVTRLDTLAEYGGYRVKFPEIDGTHAEAVIINTGGGVAGGDRLRFVARSCAGANATVTSSTSERIYGSTGPASRIDIALTATDASTLTWLPHPTILFDGANLDRNIAVDLKGDARLLIAEATMFGRAASGEVMTSGILNDQWRVRRDGRLIFAEANRLEGNIAAQLAGSAVAGGATGAALLLACGPDIGDKRDSVRATLTGLDVLAGVSAWNGCLIVRALSPRMDILQLTLRRAIESLGIMPAPTSWSA